MPEDTEHTSTIENENSMDYHTVGQLVERMKDSKHLNSPSLLQYLAKTPFPQRFSIIKRYFKRRKKWDIVVRVSSYLPTFFFILSLFNNLMDFHPTIMLYAFILLWFGEAYYSKSRKQREETMIAVMANTITKKDVPGMLSMLGNRNFKDSSYIYALLPFGLSTLKKEDAPLIGEQQWNNLRAVLKKYGNMKLYSYDEELPIAIIATAQRFGAIQLRPEIEDFVKNSFFHTNAVVAAAKECIRSFDEIPLEAARQAVMSLGIQSPPKQVVEAEEKPQNRVGDPQLDSVIASLRESHKKAKGVVNVADMILMSIFGVGLVINFVTFNPTLLIVFILLATLGYPLLRRWVYHRAMLHAAQQLANSSEVKTIPLLLEILDSAEIEIQSILFQTLERILPKVRASDAQIFSKHHLETLANLLRPDKNAVFAGYSLELAIIKSLEQIGNSTVLPIISKLAQGEGIGLDYRIQKAAIDCLPYLEQRIGLEKESQTLLRASSATEITSDQLLRAASYNEPTPSEQLLRPSE